MKPRRLIFSQQQQATEINVSPLIDIVFILLIFFIVTTVFVEETGVDVQRSRSRLGRRTGEKLHPDRDHRQR